MKRRISFVVATISLFALMAGAGSAFAALALPIRVSVPFDFVVGETTLPAGQYLISNPDDIATDLLAIRSLDGNSMVFIQGRPLSPRHDIYVAHTRLTFEKVDGREFLVRVWEAGSDSGYTIPASPLEQKAVQTATALGK